MAGKRKKESGLTLEERLKRALVLEEEQPYHVPENWVWTRLDEINHFFSQTLNPATRPEQIFELYSVPSCENNFPEIVLGSEIGSSKQYVLKNDILLCKINPRINRVWIVTGHTDHSYLASSEWIVVRTTRCNPRYLLWLFQGPYFREQMLSNVSGVGGSLMRAQPKWVNRYMLPIPPVQEQERIVDRIESLFAKLDVAKEKAQAAVDGFETRKAAILHSAFTGKLTTRWRVAHQIGFETWKVETSKELFEYVTSGSRGWAQYYSDNGAVFLRMGNLDHGTIKLELSNVQYVKLPDKAEGQRSLVQDNDILISITADVGMIGLVKTIDFEAYINQHIALARPAKKESAEFIAWYLVSDVGFRQLQQKQRGATKVGLGLEDIRSLKLKMPTAEEQQEIVRILDDLLAKEQKAKEAAAAVLERVDLIKKSILARAFRGELGTNDPSEESAVELLKQCLAEGEVVP